MTLKPKGLLISQYLDKFGGLSHLQIARKLYEDNPTIFKSVEHARTRLRYYAGKAGKANRTNITNSKNGMTEKAKQNKDILQKWGLQKTKAKGRKVYQIPAENNRILWISDIHIPNHDEEALTTALEYGIENKANCIVIGGDLIDNAPFTRFRTPPDKKKAREYFDMTTDFLASLRRNFPKALILYMEGNHDRWYSDWLMDHCAVVFDDPHYQLETRLKLDSFGITFLRENVIVKAGKLPMLHGHTVVRGVFAPVNSARGAYIKTGHSIIIGHTHQVSEHSAKDLMGRKIKVWSTGCLCTLQPDYDPHNIRHSHGFAFIETEANGTYTVSNMEIIDGVIR